MDNTYNFILIKKDQSGTMTIKSSLLLIIAISILNIVNAQTITTIAGGAGDNGAATAAILNNPVDITIDKSGNIYVADKGNQIIRKIDGTGKITRFAGKIGGSYFSGDGGYATMAETGDVEAIATDTSGQLYIADNFGGIRTVNSSGIISSYISRTYSGMSGVALDKRGNLYYADRSRDMVLKVSASGITSLFAGTGGPGFNADGIPATNSMLNRPTGLCVDKEGNVYIADNNNYRIRKVDTFGIMTTIAGNGIVGYAGDGGLAVNANLNSPYDVHADTTGNIYIADRLNNVIRKINTAGIISTVAGSFSPGFSGDGGSATSATLSGPTGITTDLSGNLYIADNLNNRIRKVNTSGMISTFAGTNFSSLIGSKGDGGPAISALLNYPSGIAIDSLQDLYIADRGNYTVRKINSSGIITTVAGNNTYGYSGDNGPATSAKLQNPVSVARDKKGNLFIADNIRIRKVNTSGIITTYAGSGIMGYSGDGGPATTAAMNELLAVATDKYGNVYVADKNRIRKIDTNRIITTIAGTGTAGYFGDGGAATSAMINNPIALLTDNSDNIYIADRNNNRVRKINTSGTITTIAGNGTSTYSGDGGSAIFAGIQTPTALTMDKSGNIYVFYKYHVRKINTGGIITTVAGDVNGVAMDDVEALDAMTFTSTSYPSGVAVDTTGNILIADETCRIRKVHNARITISTLNDTVCSGTGTFTYTATVTAAPIYTPHYHWTKNYVPVGTNSATYSSIGINNGDVIRCYITNGPSGLILANAEPIQMRIISSAAPTITINSSAGTNFCLGTTTTLNINSTSNGGTAPVFDWYKNGAYVSSGTSYTYTPAHSDTVYCKITSSIYCLTIGTGISNKVGFTVNTPVVPTVSFTNTPSGSAHCIGTSLYCRATSYPSGSYFRWFKNDSLVGYGTTYTFTFADSDKVYCLETFSASTCTTNDTAVSPTRTFYIPPTPVASISIYSDATGLICENSMVTCTPIASSSGATNRLDWYVNGTWKSSGSYYSFRPITGDSVTCQLTAGNTCGQTAIVMSNTIGFDFIMRDTPTVSFSTNSGDSICWGQQVTCTAATDDTGAFIYKWYNNGSVRYTGNPYVFQPRNGDDVYCQIINNSGCNQIIVNSDPIEFKVKDQVVPKIGIELIPSSTVCAGTPLEVRATATNGGYSPTFEWFRNGSSIATGPVYTFAPDDGDNIYCKLTSNEFCLTKDTVTSEGSSITVDTLPSVSITANPGPTMYRGTSATFTANASDYSIPLTYQSTKNGAQITGATNATYTSIDFSIWDSVQCIVTANGVCTGTIKSNTLLVNTYHEMRAYPNPNNGDFVITGNDYNANGNLVGISIFNSNGSLVHEQTAQFNLISFRTEIKLNRVLAPGVYRARVVYDKNTTTIPFVIKY